MNANIKLIKGDSRCCIFNIEDFSLFDIDELTYNVLNHFLETGDIVETSKKFNVAENELYYSLKSIGYEEAKDITSNNEIQQYIRSVQRITLHVSNDCNLRCKYCYASGGAYGKNRGMMTIETAKRFVDYCCDNYDRVDNVVFFGGEPFLNIQIIDFVCKYFQEKFDSGKISNLPRFGAITNGTLLSDKVFSVIEKYFSFLTVSIDGPKEINDMNRVTTNGDGSFDKINLFLKRVSTIHKLNVHIEVTYTSQHIEKGFSREMIKRYFMTEFNLNADIVDEISLNHSQLAVEELNDPLNSPWFFSVLKSVINKRHETKCPILQNIFAISIEGDIYPCHMNIGDGMLPVSSIWNSGRNLIDEIQHNGAYSLKENSTCRRCWARNICGGCSRLYFYDSDDKKYNHLPIKKQCDFFKRILSLSLLKICEVRKNPALWSNLLDKVRETTRTQDNITTQD